ncbi:M15 family metallopeptidase [Sphingomonas sp. 8AM]|uniref:M15 family metallopeptidase n=1 Tax=Sphingomonas sp. 8AM TaxID=2653170 RepID=UPI0012F116EA|nr:M15 family metallopeptidase [Sphingomonas sp. 8AM]VXC87847.1 D-alanyl-D-alanine carboxypeptidase [Sphingomonas sp. 8AM]
MLTQHGPALASWRAAWPEGAVRLPTILAALATLAAAPVQAQLCDGRRVPTAADGRVLGHLPYGDAAPDALVAVPSALSVSPCVLRREVLPDLQRLIEAAVRDPVAGGQVLALSCHRSITYQEAVFCREGQIDAAQRALSVAPPGHSEHATGFALDFAFRPRRNDCPDAEACVAATPAFRWLMKNAPHYGFEMSFPAGNRQRVKWEPWHWRWVGVRATVPGAARARALFAAARVRYPAEPAVARDPVVIAQVAAPPVYIGAIAPPECRKGKCRAARAKKR